MNLAPCPNCSRYNPLENQWKLGRPQLYTGRHSGKVFIVGCCAFSGASWTAYRDEAAAERAWELYRVKASADNARLASALAALNAYGKPAQPTVVPVATPQPALL